MALCILFRIRFSSHFTILLAFSLCSFLLRQIQRRCIDNAVEKILLTVFALGQFTMFVDAIDFLFGSWGRFYHSFGGLWPISLPLIKHLVVFDHRVFAFLRALARFPSSGTAILVLNGILESLDMLFTDFREISDLAKDSVYLTVRASLRNSLWMHLIKLTNGFII